jgi:hypothetical protein
VKNQASEVQVNLLDSVKVRISILLTHVSNSSGEFQIKVWRNEGDYYEDDDDMYDEGCYYEDKGYYYCDGRYKRKVLLITSPIISLVYA